MTTKETFEQANEDLAEILNALDDTTAALENVLLHLGNQMTPADQAARWGVVKSNQALLKRIGWGRVMTTTIYIHPAYTDQAGQCRIYATNGLGDLCAAIDYQVRPNLWREVGIMNSRGELVCFDGPREWRQTLVDSQPLMAGTTFTFGEPT